MPPIIDDPHHSSTNRAVASPGEGRPVSQGPTEEHAAEQEPEAGRAGGLGDPGGHREGGPEDPGNPSSSIKTKGSSVCSRGNLGREAEWPAPGVKYAKAEGGGGGRGEGVSISGDDGGGAGGGGSGEGEGEGGEQIRGALLGLGVLSTVVTDGDDRTGRNCPSLQPLPTQEAGDRGEGGGAGDSTGADDLGGDGGGGGGRGSGQTPMVTGENNHQSALLEKSGHDHLRQASRGEHPGATTSLHEQGGCEMLEPSGHRKSAACPSVRPKSHGGRPNRDDETAGEGGNAKARCSRNFSDPHVPAEEHRARNLEDRGGWGEFSSSVTGAEVASGAAQRRQRERIDFRAVLDDPLGLSLFRRRVVLHDAGQTR